MKKGKNIIIGLILVLVGILWGLKKLDILSLNIFFDGWWTLFIIIPSISGLVDRNDKDGKGLSFIFLFVGVSLLLCEQGIMKYDLLWDLLFPVILVVIGLSFAFKDFFNKKVNEKIKEINKNSKGEEEYTAVFSGQKLNFDDRKLENTELTAVFGGVDLDLRKAIIKKDVVIEASSVFGGINILVPNNVKVITKSSSLFGGVDDSRKDIDTKDNSVTIYVNASCLFGGVTIK